MRDGSPPPELSRALNYKSWGVADVMRLPAGLLPRMNVTLNYYHALAGYKNAQSQNKTNDWIKANPKQWDMVSRIIKMRLE